MGSHLRTLQTLLLIAAVLTGPCVVSAEVRIASGWPASSRQARVHHQHQQQGQQQRAQQHNLRRPLRQPAAVLTRHPAAVAAARHILAADPPIIAGRRLQQIAGLANFAVGAQVQASQRATAALGSLAALSNYYGLEGFGLRHRLGAIPAPGALEVLAIGGPQALPGPEGFTAGFLAAAAENARVIANPVDTAALRDLVRAAAGTVGLEAGRVGPPGTLESSSGGAAAGLSKLGMKGKLLGRSGLQMQTQQSSSKLGPAAAQGNMDGAQTAANLGNGLQVNNRGVASMQGDVAAPSSQPGVPGTQGYVGVANVQANQAAAPVQGNGLASMQDTNLAAAPMTAEAGQTAGALNAGTGSAGGSSSGRGVLKGANGIWQKLTGSRVMPSAASATESGKLGTANGSELVSVTPGWKGIDTVTGQVPGVAVVGTT